MNDSAVSTPLYDPALAEIITAQRRFFAAGKTRDVSFRRQLLKNLRIMLRESETLLLEALRADLGKSSREAYLTEIGMVERELNHALRQLSAWTAPRAAASPLTLQPSYGLRIPRPRGITMIFSPWHCPFQQAVIPLISSIAAGNCTILKLPEHSPHTSRLLMERLDRYFDREYLAAYMDSFEAIKAIRREPLGLIFYSGGSTVARIVSRAAAAQLTPVVLTLGGKSPAIVDSTADLRLAARSIVTGKLLSAGQNSAAPDYLCIERSVKAEFLGYVREYHDRFCSLTSCGNECCPKIINRMHFERLKRCLSDGTILMGGGVDEASGRIELTLMENIRSDSKLLREEIFGPILPVFTFGDMDALIRALKKRPTPLALYLFTGSRAVRRRVLSELDFGCGCVNDTMVQLANPRLPFGGMGESGYGRCHGKAGFDTFSAQSSVHIASRITPPLLRFPPFGDDVGLLRYFT